MVIKSGIDNDEIILYRIVRLSVLIGWHLNRDLDKMKKLAKKIFGERIPGGTNRWMLQTTWFPRCSGIFATSCLELPGPLPIYPTILFFGRSSNISLFFIGHMLTIYCVPTKVPDTSYLIYTSQQPCKADITSSILKIRKLKSYNLITHISLRSLGWNEGFLILKPILLDFMISQLDSFILFLYHDLDFGKKWCIQHAKSCQLVNIF